MTKTHVKRVDSQGSEDLRQANPIMFENSKMEIKDNVNSINLNF